MNTLNSYMPINSMNLKYYSISVLVTTLFLGLLCSTFANITSDNYLQLFPIACSVGLVSVSALLSFILSKTGRFRLSFLDVLFFIIIAYYVLRYDYQLQLANWKIIYATLLLILWFSARIILSYVSVNRSILLFCLIGAGCIQAVLGILQLYGFMSSHHFLYSITGSFGNPGPYSGYIAMMFPVCLSQVLSTKGWKLYLSLSVFSLMICTIPAGMSRSAWIALLVACLWVLVEHKGWISKIKEYRKDHPKKTAGYVLLALLVMSLAFSCLFLMKADSANGRLFIWKNTGKVILEHPIIGSGPGSFPFLYGKAQSSYFAAGNYTPQEERVAGCPEYAFNEYLQLGVEGGAVLAILLLVFIVLVLRKGMLNKEYGACGGLLSLLIFSFSSYPLQILPFGIAGILIVVICVSDREVVEEKKKRSVVTPLCLVLLLSGATYNFYSLRNTNLLKDMWYKTGILETTAEYQAAITGYSRLYEKLKHNSDFLFSYARSLAAEKRFDEANRILERAERISCDAIIHNIKGRYSQQAGRYSEAERSYQQAINMLPCRIYPYYLLAKLYAEPSFYNKDKMEQMARVVLTKEPKVHSKAIEEMRTEMIILLGEITY